MNKVSRLKKGVFVIKRGVQNAKEETLDFTLVYDTQVSKTFLVKEGE